MLIPTPDLLRARRLLCVQPHYDDNDIGAGGTIARLADAGAEVHYLTVTDDVVGVLDRSTSTTQKRAAGSRPSRSRAGPSSACARSTGSTTRTRASGARSRCAARSSVTCGGCGRTSCVTVDPWLPLRGAPGPRAHRARRRGGVSPVRAAALRERRRGARLGASSRSALRGVALLLQRRARTPSSTSARRARASTARSTPTRAVHAGGPRAAARRARAQGARVGERPRLRVR